MISRALRFVFVVPRYGDDVLGGAEKLARDVAEHIVQRGHTVRVLTTCATDYLTWSNHLEPGDSSLRGVDVVRFPVRFPRLRPFDSITKTVASAFRRIRAPGAAWLVAQGPVVPALLDRLQADAMNTDLFVFFGLLSHATSEGLKRVGERSALVSLVHDEPPTYSRIARDTLRLPRALLALTEEEWHRILRVAGPGLGVGAIVGAGCDAPPPREPSFLPPTDAPYFLILGRLAKTRPMLRVWRELLRRSDLPQIEDANGRAVPWSEVKLVTAGELSDVYRGIPNVVSLPFIDDATRWQLMHGALAIVNPSLHESLSLVLLEAWTCRKPVIVNSKCDVTTGQCRRASGGVAIDFDNPRCAAEQLTHAIRSSSRRAEMGASGAAYVAQRYDWDRVVDAYEAAAIACGRGGSLVDALAPWAPGPPGSNLA